MSASCQQVQNQEAFVLAMQPAYTTPICDPSPTTRQAIYLRKTTCATTRYRNCRFR